MLSSPVSTTEVVHRHRMSGYASASEGLAMSFVSGIFGARCTVELPNVTISDDKDRRTTAGRVEEEVLGIKVEYYV